MATIMHAGLQITPSGQKQSKVIVTCRVRFTKNEMGGMGMGLKFRLDCRVFGQDMPIDPDDFLFAMGSKIFPDPTPTIDESVTFTAVTSLLDEDPGTDEVYARLFLRNLSTGLTVTRKSNVVVQAF